jgi:DNA-directed RNA polymerase alpha subunit
MLARKGTGRTHAKWSPVATCIMYRDPIVRIDKDLINALGTDKINDKDVDLKQEFVKACPRQVFNFNELTQSVDIEKAGDCNLCEECVKFGELHGLDSKAVYIGENDTKFNFSVESTGAMPPVDIVRRAFKILKQKINTFSSDLMESVTGSTMKMGY